jgi:hypothetical protein
MTNIYYTRIGDLGMKLQFLNGSITIPNKPGAYVVAPGCGSGKTTAIRQIIRENFSTGILYSAATIEECNDMYQHCKGLVDEFNDPDILKLDDIIVLHSDYRSEGTDNNLWRNNPEALADKKILICTHYKLMNEDPDLLTSASFNSITYDSLNKSNYMRAMRDKIKEEGIKVTLEKPRRFIIIDELPTTGARLIEVTRNDLLSYALRNDPSIESYLPENIRMSLPTLMTTSLETSYRVPNSYRQFVGTYTAANNKELPKMFSSKENITDTRTLEQVRLDNEMGSIYDRFQNLWSELQTEYLSKSNEDRDRENSNPSRKVGIGFLNSLSKENSIDCQLLLFDGTGDLTFKDSELFEIRTLPEGTRKYNSPVTLTEFETHLKRRQRAVNKAEGSLINELEFNVNQLEKILKENQKTLIVTWKNLKSDSEYSDESEFLISKTNERKSLTRYYDSILGSRGFIKGVHYDIIHYQSGKDKATNEFVEYDSIVFLGEFHVPNSVVNDFNEIFKCKTNPGSYLMYQLVQTVSRIRIRQHKGLPINIYYSNDWNPRVMEALVTYLTLESSPEPRKVPVRTLDEGVIGKVQEPYKSEIYKLDEDGVLPGVVRSINEGSPMNYRVKLEDLYNSVPRGEYKVRSYSALLDRLRTLRVNIEITTESNRKR